MLVVLVKLVNLETIIPATLTSAGIAFWLLLKVLEIKTLNLLRGLFYGCDISNVGLTFREITFQNEFVEKWGVYMEEWLFSKFNSFICFNLSFKISSNDFFKQSCKRNWKSFVLLSTLQKFVFNLLRIFLREMQRLWYGCWIFTRRNNFIFKY